MGTLHRLVAASGVTLTQSWLRETHCSISERGRGRLVLHESVCTQHHIVQEVRASARAAAAALKACRRFIRRSIFSIRRCCWLVLHLKNCKGADTGSSPVLSLMKEEARATRGKTLMQHLERKWHASVVRGYVLGQEKLGFNSSVPVRCMSQSVQTN